METKFKYEKVIDYIYKNYVNSANSNNGEIPSEPQLAKTIGISRYPVNQAYNKLVETGVLMRIPGIGTFIRGKEPKKFQIKMSKKLVGLASFLNNFSVDVMQGIQDVFIPKGILTASILNNDQDEEQALEQLVSMEIKGIFMIPQIFFGEGVHPCFPYINKIYSKNLIPIILERPMEGFSGTQVLVDNAGGTAIATEYFLNAGRENIAYIGKDDYIVGKERYQGYLTALNRNGIKPNEELIHLDQSSDKFIDNLETFVKTSIESIFKTCPSCNTFVTFGSTVAYSIYQYLKRKNLFKPDMLFAGYDSLSIAEREFKESYISLERPLREIGRIGAQAMIDVIDNGNYNSAIIKRILPDIHLPSRKKTTTWIENTEIHSL